MFTPYKNLIIDFVQRNPGCTKMDVARIVTRNPRRSPSKQYDVVNTAIKYGWIKAAKLSSGRYSLTTKD